MKKSEIVPEFESLSVDEMNSIQGAGEMQSETTPVCAIAATVAESSGVCSSVATGVTTGATVVLTIKRCK
ncbi:lichenicidin A2 family type 2 lantibiotic [Companilactobacillus metriopterae]|uniref:lichenicidin A2 family type 2 lantibiotic n=1 Tax=Companilactobacillus metriopterae TaxID=1909267 RepID=UPI00100A741F|nr:mersacidin family lantibiotic [Companilactobacillus metriopterae]